MKLRCLQAGGQCRDECAEQPVDALQTEQLGCTMGRPAAHMKPAACTARAARIKHSVTLRPCEANAPMAGPNTEHVSQLAAPGQQEERRELGCHTGCVAHPGMTLPALGQIDIEPTVHTRLSSEARSRLRAGRRRWQHGVSQAEGGNRPLKGTGRRASRAVCKVQYTIGFTRRKSGQCRVLAGPLTLLARRQRCPRCRSVLARQ